MTVLFYLNDVIEGGETHFPQIGLTVHPKRGRVVIWPNIAYSTKQGALPETRPSLNRQTHHASLPVMQGHKYVATQWVHAGPVRTGQG